MQTSIKVIPLVLISTLYSCASKDTILPQPTQTMLSVYEKHSNSSDDKELLDTRSLLRRPMVEGDTSLSEFVRTEKTQLESKFQLLPNPTMYMFVAPHLATDSNVPIPGYLTEFKMWEADQYALPWEITNLEERF